MSIEDADFPYDFKTQVAIKDFFINRVKPSQRKKKYSISNEGALETYDTKSGELISSIPLYYYRPLSKEEIDIMDTQRIEEIIKIEEQIDIQKGLLRSAYAEYKSSSKLSEHALIDAVISFYESVGKGDKKDEVPKLVTKYGTGIWASLSRKYDPSIVKTWETNYNADISKGKKSVSEIVRINEEIGDLEKRKVYIRSPVRSMIDLEGVEKRRVYFDMPFEVRKAETIHQMFYRDFPLWKLYGKYTDSKEVYDTSEKQKISFDHSSVITNV